MGIITKARSQGQKAIYWQRMGQDQFGKPTYTTPVEMNVRWDRSIQKVITAQGDERLSSSQVMVDRLLNVGDLIKEATLESLTSQLAVNNDDVYEVLAFSAIPDFRNKETLFIAYL